MWLVTVTAPGQDVLPWDLQHCGHEHEGRCSGKRGCRVQPDAAARWNATAPRRMTRLHRRVSQWVRRRMPGQLQLLENVWQYQERGALHLHLVLGVGTPAHRHAAELYVGRLHEVAAEYGFGWPDRNGPRLPGERAAAYITKYLIVGNGAEAVVTETVRREDCPSRLVYVSNALSKRTGCTMRSLRRERYLWHLEREQLRADGYFAVPADVGRSLHRLACRQAGCDLDGVVLQT